MISNEELGGGGSKGKKGEEQWRGGVGGEKGRRKKMRGRAEKLRVGIGLRRWWWERRRGGTETAGQ